MEKFNKAALDKAIGGAAMESAAPKEDKKVISQIIIRNVPAAWQDAVKVKAYMKMTDFCRQAIKEKLEREGLI